MDIIEEEKSHKVYRGNIELINLGWFELWLDHQEETDYFKDYVYG